MPLVDSNLFDDVLENKWSQLIELRDEVLKALEEARKSKLIGNSLAAAVHLYPTNAQAELLSSFYDLEKIMIVSAVQLHPASERDLLTVEVVVAEGEKCERCWNVTKDVGSHSKHKTCCARCAEVVELELG
jgi:isoleucyl-tRNA synthetase